MPARGRAGLRMSLPVRVAMGTATLVAALTTLPAGGLSGAAVHRGTGAGARAGGVVVVTQRDLPGYRPAPPLERPAARIALERCLDLPRGRLASSSSFVRDGGLQVERVASQVIEFAAPSDAARAAADLASQAAPSCLEPFDRQELAPLAAADGVGLQAAVVAPLVLPVHTPGAAFAYRLAASTGATARRGPVSVFVDLAGFAVGRALVELQVVSVTELFPASLERRLLAGLVARARRRFG